MCQRLNSALVLDIGSDGERVFRSRAASAVCNADKVWVKLFELVQGIVNGRDVGILFRWKYL